MEHTTGSGVRSAVARPAADVVSSCATVSRPELALWDPPADMGVIHFSGHGEMEPSPMFLQLSDGDRIGVEDLAFRITPKLIILNVCGSAALISDATRLPVPLVRATISRLNDALCRRMREPADIPVPAGLTADDRGHGLSCALVHSGPPLPWPGAADRRRPDDVAAEDPFDQFVRRVANRVSRLVRGAPRSISFRTFRKMLLRAAILVLCRMLDIRRHDHGEQPAALTHQHAVDQYRIRGPNAGRKTSPPVVLRELAVV